MAQARTGDPGRRDTPGAGRAGTPTGRHGSTVAGRYRLDEPRSGDLPGSERWSATDQILARTVTVTLVSGPRTAAVLDAARRAALVVDPRLARILDVGSADGTGYVVTEAVEGRSLSALAARAPLTADQARAVVGEAAAALEVARRRGVHHLALRPEAVVLTPGSRVVLEGLAVDGELLGAAGGGAHAMSRTDTVGLVRVLYAALTGRWPGVSAGAEPPVMPTFDEWSASSGPAARQPAGDPEVDPGLPAAPEHDGAPLPPADLVAGVPADLDTLCAVTLGPHDDGPHSPGELVRELEPWRAVRADEIFRTADAGRWPAMPAQAGAPAAATAATGTTTAPPTGSSPMSDDQHGSSTAPGGRPADDSTPATGSTGATAAGAAAAGAAAAGATAAGAAAAGAAGASASGHAAAGGAAAGAAAAGAAAGAEASGKVARQSVRSAFAARPGAGARRPGTPPPAAPAPASFPPAAPQGPQRTSARTPAAAAQPQATPSQATTPEATPSAPAAVPPARSASPAEPAPSAAPASADSGTALPPAIPPASTARQPSAAEGPSPAEAPAAAELAVAGITAVSDERADEPSGAPTDGAATSDGGATAPAPTAVVPTPVRRTSSAFGRPAAAASTATTPAAGTASAATTAHRPEQPFLPEPLAPEEQPDDAPLPPAAGGGGDGPSRPDWDLPFPSERPAESVTERRFDPTRWVLGLVALAVVVGVVVALANVLSPFGSGDDDAGAAATQAPVTTAPPAEEPAAGEDEAAGEAPAAVPPVIAGVTTIDPSDGDGEHEELVGRLVDGDPATTWYTHTYNRPDFAGFKDAVGLVITLQAPATVTSVTLDVNGSGGNVEVRSTDAANPTAGDVLAAGALAPQTVLTLAQPTETQSLVLWFTSLSQTPDGQNRIEISTVAVS